MKAFIVAIMFSAIAVSVRAQGQMVTSGAEILTQASRGQNYYNQNTMSEMVMVMTTIPILTPSPNFSGVAPNIQPSSSFAIQAVPEPNSSALLVAGLLTGAFYFRRSTFMSRG